jgi:alkanesulfonate monooxygenase
VVFEGQHIRLNGALVSPSPSGEGLRMYLGGASDAALGLAGRQAEVYLAWIQPLEAIADLLDRVRGHYAAAGRMPRFGLRTHLVVRDSEDDAWRAADDLLSQAAGAVQAQRQAVFAGMPMVGQQAQARAYAEHRVGRHLWNGISTVRVNCGTAIVGAPEQVAEELLGYWRLGIDEFIVSGYPHVEESRRVARDVLPLLRAVIQSEG